MKTVATEQAPGAVGPYSQAVVSGGFVFVSGQIPLVPESGELLRGDIGKQTRQVMRNLQAVLQAAGTDLNRVVKAQVYLLDMSHFAAVNEVYAEFFGSHRPARACVAVRQLPKGAEVEIDVVAEVDS